MGPGTGELDILKKPLTSDRSHQTRPEKEVGWAVWWGSQPWGFCLPGRETVGLGVKC